MSDEITARLSRWSQRKLAARRGGALPVEPEETPAQIHSEEKTPASAPQTTDAGAEANATTDADLSTLPPIDELTFESDYTGFLAKNVPEALRREALRKLWRSDPVFAVLDGLNDYCEDFNVVDLPITMAQTSYVPGKGYIDEIEEKIEKELLESGDQVADASAESQPAADEPERASDDAATAGSDEPSDDTLEAPRQLAADEPDTEAGEFPIDRGKNEIKS
jgi:Protein of unknown function (DUF3306)